ncbi:MAG TPA: NfeD family protein [Thermoleophilaceae bacterium]|nr:NfeD family protein [Thermoleophilaceae bacterium]
MAANRGLERLSDRRPRRLALAAVAVALAASLAGAVPAQEEEAGQRAHAPPGLVSSIELSGTIDPATRAWLDEALEQAELQGARLALIKLDTPGGLDTAMRDMVQRIVAAELPVIVYVAPNGARAASAGLFVTMAADVAAMAPQTNIGSATPVSIGPGPQNEVLGRKVTNDAAAYVRALAEGHGRNGNLAERMVREAANVTAERALAENLIDVVAPNERALLDRLDGFRVKGPKTRALDTAGLQIERREMPFRYEVRQFLVNPTVAFLLLLAGLAGIGIELFAPGAIAPGALGAVALLLGLYGTVQLPVTLVGILLLLLALGLFFAETQVASGGALGAGGAGALVAAGLLLFDTDSPVFEVSLLAAVAAGALLGGFAVFALSKALRSGSRVARGGPEELVGEIASVRSRLDPEGQVFVHGALWRARSADEGWVLEVGERVRVESVEGLTLTVRPVESTGDPAGMSDGSTQ